MVAEVNIKFACTYYLFSKMSSANSVGAYGAGWATGNFDPIVYIRKPSVILRLVAWVSSLFSVSAV